MQRVEGVSRGFSLSHQKVALELAFATHGTVAQGYTELTIIPADKNLKTVHLHARQTSIDRVTCAGRDAEFSLVDHLSTATLSDLKDVHLFPELTRKLYAGASDGIGGELGILLPDNAVQEVNEADAATDFAPVNIRIYYSISDPSEALQVVMPTNEAPHRIPHMYTSPTCPDSTRFWLPCIDSLWERCTWELQFIVPREVDGEAVSVIASGDLVEQVAHPHSSNKTIYYYTQATATSAQHIGFSAGPFVFYDVPLAKPSDDAGRVLAFCLPGREEEMFNSVGVMHQALDFYSREFGSYPFGSMKVAFVDDPVLDAFILSTFAICSSDLLFPSSVIDQAFETRHTLAHAVAFQWVGINIVQKTWSDTWLVNGLSLYITGLFMRRLLGNNEYRFRLKKDCDRLLAWDVGQPPLCSTGRTEPPDEDALAFISLKAPLILHILDRRLCKAGATLGLGRVIPKVFLQAITGEMVNATLSTSSFLRTCRKVSGIELKRFAEQWIHGSGYPEFTCNANFNKKKLLIEFNFQQYSRSWEYAVQNPVEAAGSNPIQVFEGQMTVRIHEADGTPYEHVFDLNAASKRFEVPFNTKYKRVRRNTKRFKSRQAAAKAAAEGDEGAAEDISLMDLGFGLGMWEEEEQRERWRVADWTEEDEAQMSSAPYEWIRLDADFEWIAHIQFDQRDYMWVSQLQRDRDVVAQVGAIQALGSMPNAISCSMLTRTALVTKYFYRIRIEAIHHLVGCALASLDYLGLFHLLMLFRTAFCHETGEQTDLDVPCIPRANDFSDFAEYFIKRALVQAISNVRNERGRTLPQVKKFIINLLRYNDNSKNKFVDDFYTATLVSSLASAFVPRKSFWGQYVPPDEDPDAAEDEALLQAARFEVERFQELDKLVPSYHNAVTLACLDFQSNMMLANLLPVDLPMLHAYTRQGNFVPVRTVALDYLLLLHGLQHKVLTRYFFALLRSDESRTTKRALARSICQVIAVAVAVGEKRDMMTAIEEEAGEATDTQRLEDMLKTFRREVGRSASVREGFLEALLHPRVDTGERWALLKLGELIFKAAEEREVPFQPKVSVRVRMPTANEQVQEEVAKTAEREQAAKEPVPSQAAAKIKLVRTETTPRVAFDEVVKKKKIKPVAPGQASGMSLTDLTACRNCLAKLQRSKQSQPFRKPVDPVRDKAPDYFNIIQSPMDLSSILNKLGEGLYKDRFEFKNDFELMVSNAKTYTPDPKHSVHKAAVALEREFHNHWNRITNTLAQAAANSLGNPTGNGIVEQEVPASSEGTAVETSASAGTQEPVASADADADADAEVNSESTVDRTVETIDDAQANTNRGAPSPANGPRPLSPTASMPPPPPPAAKGLKIKLKPKLGGLGSPATQEPKPSTAPSPTPLPSLTPEPDSQQVSRTKKNTKGIKASASPSRSPAPAPSPQPSRPKSVQKGSDKASANIASAPIQTKKCRQLLQNLRKTPEAGIFLRPVDPVADGAPTYFDEIKEPMDLGTMGKKLEEGGYSTMGQFRADFELIVANCRQFNPPGTVAVELADALEEAFKREWRVASVLKLEYNETRALQGLLSKLKQVPEATIFLQPVDPIALGIPHYFEVIPRDKARDLSLIETKLKGGQYATLLDFDADIRLMLHNCSTFNAQDAELLAFAQRFESQYNKLWHDIKSRFGLTTAAHKRKAGAAAAAAAGSDVEAAATSKRKKGT